MCGAKISNDRIGAATRSDAELVNLECLASLAIKSGKSVGVVTTTRVTHASPAALYAKTNDRQAEVHSANERYQVKIVDKEKFGSNPSFFVPFKLFYDQYKATF